MSLVINNNMMAANTARNLNTHYGNLATSTQRLSSGLRINGAADDAAGLAIRELMRADIAAYNQGIRNANDAISMIQVVDGALGIIDEKLIRMKELAEQAATGTYDSTQRLMIDSEFQAMASEIQRIATATDFNGIKLIDGIYNHFDNKNETSTKEIQESSKYTHYTPGFMGSVREDTITTKITEDKDINYIYKEDGLYRYTNIDTTIETKTESIRLNLSQLNVFSYPNSLGSIARGGEILNTDFFDIIDPNNTGGCYWVGNSDKYSILDIQYEYIDKPTHVGGNHLYNIFVDINGDNIADARSYIYADHYSDISTISKYIDRFVVDYDRNGPYVTTNLDKTNQEIIEKVTHHEIGDIIRIHFGPMNDSAEDYYDIEKRDCTLKGLGLEDVRIETQDNAQKALVTINDAIVKKDQARAYYGAMQNRLENTVSNLTIQAENLQASESRISDVDVATEMTNFVRNQILTQSAVAMLSQANSMPQMAMQLIGG